MDSFYNLSTSSNYFVPIYNLSSQIYKQVLLLFNTACYMINILTDMQDKNSNSAITRLRYNSPTTEKSLKTSNYVQEITSFEPPIPCSHHYNDNICYICIDCKYKCLCGSCLQEGLHKTHHVKNVEKGSRIVDRTLNQSLIRLRSKSDLLTNLKDYMKIRKSEIYHQYSEYEQLFNINFDTLASDLAEKKREMIEMISQFHSSVSDKIDSLIQQVNAESLLTLQLINHVEDKIDKYKQYPTSLCLFYEEKNFDISKMVDESTIKFEEFKRKAPEIEWSVDLQIFEVLRGNIRYLGFETKQNYIGLNSLFTQNKKVELKKPDGKIEKSKYSNFSGSQTPKNSGIKNRFFKSPLLQRNKKSKGKLTSMPGSPSKQQLSENKSAKKVKGQQGSRKFKKNKKTN